MADLSLKSGLLRINDIELAVPPKNITIIKQDFNAGAAALRSQTSTWVKSGRKTATIIVDTYFATGYNALTGKEETAESWINTQLAPLIIQTRKCPFVSIENEKIRKEVLGDPEVRSAESFENANMAAVIKQIDIESKIKEPEMFHVRIHMEWFNYLPYSPDFKFKRVDNERITAVDVPDNQFSAFVQSGTTIPGTSSQAPIFINSILPASENDLEIIYKEYKRLDAERINPNAELEKLISLDLDESDQITPPLAAKRTEIELALEELRKEGWRREDEFQSANNEPGYILSRYRRFKIKDIAPDQILDSGRLLVESSMISLQTKVATMPLLGHSYPTSQFLGVSDGNINLSIFANAELENGSDDGKPVGTSDKLSKLNGIIDLVAMNAVTYRRLSKNDSIFIKHPMAKLLKYKPYEESNLAVLDEESGRIETFNPNEYLGCIVQGTESQTVPGLPYCSRFTLSLSENYTSKISNVRQSSSGASNRVYQATKDLIKKLIDKYDIQPGTDKVINITRDPNKRGKEALVKKIDEVSNRYVRINASGKGVPTGDPDYPVAQKLADYLDASFSLKEFKDSKDIVDDKEFIEQNSRTVDKRYNEHQYDNEPFSIRDLKRIDPEAYAKLEQTKNKDEFIRESNRIIRERQLKRKGKLENQKPLSANRMNEIAFELLKVMVVREDNDPILQQYKEQLEIFKSWNLTVEESNYPDMMLPAQNMQPDFFFYNKSDETNNKFKKKVLAQVDVRFKEVFNQFAEEVSNPEAALNIGEDIQPAPGPVSPAPNIVALGEDEDSRPEKTPLDKEFVQNPLDINSDAGRISQQSQNILSTVDFFEENTYTMRRSMPTFKLFIKEGDLKSLSDIDKDRLERLSPNGIWRNFTDFYDLNSIVDIRLVKDKYNPADLLVIRMTNTREDIINKFYEDTYAKDAPRPPKAQKTKPKSGETKGKEKRVDSNQLDEVMIKEGTRIELRLGYEGDPNLLNVEFSGRVAQVSGGDVVEIVCQGDGIELVQELKGVGVEDTNDAGETSELISEILHSSPEVVSFGSVNAKNTLGDIDLFWSAAGGRTVVENIFAPSIFSTWDNWQTTRNVTAGIGSAFGASVGLSTGAGIAVVSGGAGTPLIVLTTSVGAAIGYAAGFTVGAVITGVAAIFNYFSGNKYVIYEQTIWDILQELTLRHPGTICDVVNFDRRSTIFFGYPDQLYFYRGTTFEEALVSLGTDVDRKGVFDLNERNSQEWLLAKTGKGDLSRSFFKSNLRKEIKKTKRGKKLATNTVSVNGLSVTVTEDDDQLVQSTATKADEIMLSTMKQYRSYHMITSEHDIIDNGMIVNSDGVYNAIQVVHPKNDNNINFNGSVGFSSYEKSDTVAADDDLIKDFVKKQTLVFHNAHNDFDSANLPERYAVSSLCKSLSRVYQGKIKILGRSGIKPHDVVYIYDTYNNIYGAIDVENVVHTFSYSTGWVTEITPNLLVFPSTSTSAVHINAVQRMTHAFYLKNSITHFSSPLFNYQGTLDNDVLGPSTFSQSAAKTLDAASGLAGPGGSLLLAGRTLIDGSKFIEAAGITGVTTGALKIGVSRLFGSALPILGDLMVNYVTGWYVNWSRFRQPIMFMPVTRNGKPWYTGLYGLNNNTEIDAIKRAGRDLLSKGEFFIDYMKQEFPEIFD